MELKLTEQSLSWLRQSADNGSTMAQIVLWLVEQRLTENHPLMLLPATDHFIDPNKEAIANKMAAALLGEKATTDHFLGITKMVHQNSLPPKPLPPAITGRPPRLDECDTEGRVWLWNRGSSMEPPAWTLEHHSVVVEGLGIPGYNCRWRPAASLPVEGEVSE